MKELERKSLEQKIQKTAANLKVVDHRLPGSFEEKDSYLVPNSISTKTFKKGLTLHALLCDTKPCARQQHSLSKSNKSRMGKRTLSQEHVDQKPKIAFYQNLNSTLVSSSAVEHFEQSFSYEGLVPPANFDDICSTSKNHHGSFGSAGCTPVKKMQWDKHNNAAEEDQCFGPMVEFGGCEAKGTPEKVELNESSETLVDDLNQQLKELKEKLTSANEKLGTVANQMDKTLNESFVGMEQPNEWANKESANGTRDMKTTNKGLKGKSTQTMGSWSMGFGAPFGKDNSAVPKMSSDFECKMRTECRELMRKHIETLREHMKVRVFLLHAKRKAMPAAEKKNGQRKFKALMDEFDEAKRKIKADFKRGNADKGMMAKHYVEIGQLQRETRILQAKLQQIVNGKNAVENASRFSSVTIHQQFDSLFNFVNMDKRTDFVEIQKTDGRDSLANFSSFQDDPLNPQMPLQFQPAISPQIPPLNFDQLSVNDIEYDDNDGGGEGLLNKTFTLPEEHNENVHEEEAENENGSNADEGIWKEEIVASNLSASHSDVGNVTHNQNSDKISSEVKMVECHADGVEHSKEGGGDNVSFSELTSIAGGNTSDDITSIPYPSEADNRANKDEDNVGNDDKANGEEQRGLVSSQNSGSTPTSSRRVKYKICAEERGSKVEVLAHGRQMDVERMHCVVQQQQQQIEETERSKTGQNEILPMGDGSVDDDEQSEPTAAEESTQSAELADSVFEEPTQNSNSSPTSKMEESCGPTNTGECTPIAQSVHGKRQRGEEEEEEEVEVISAKSLVRSSALTQRTLAEVESIPEELSMASHSAKSVPNSSVSTVSSGKGMVVALELVAEHQQQQQTDDSIAEEVFSEDVVSTFKPSEKSLHSILSLRSNSMSTSARDSMGKLRRDSASEALLKLRTMNCVPELRSPRESKSPPKPLRSPRGIDRFMAKFPHNSSREASFSEELSVKGEMLDELPNASQIGMLFDVSGASVEGTLSKLDSTADSKRRQSDIFVGTDKRTDSVESNKMERGNSLGSFGVPEVCSAGVKARAEKTSHVQLDTNRILLAQFVYDHLNIWPTQEMLMETDLEVIRGLCILMK
ncbi:hypothetical protein niasHT_001259 [Heterodera trifolii]|uniref:Uncharacterized protein n=1 Tax=Heterodera trifolii TaxID=157864 RepID=A0ABD2M6D9_9BILA